MKSVIKITSLISLYLFSCSSNIKKSQTHFFEGKIHYNVSFKLKQDNLDTSYLRNLIGYSSTFYFKNGNYRQDYDMANLQREIYLSKENKSYFKRNDTDTLFWREMSVTESNFLKFEINKSKTTILNVICDELILYYDNKICRYFFNSNKLSIDPAWFASYKAFNKDFTTEKMKALFLKCELEYPQFISIFTADSITQEPLPNNIFEIPKNSILKHDK